MRRILISCCSTLALLSACTGSDTTDGADDGEAKAEATTGTSETAPDETAGDKGETPKEAPAPTEEKPDPTEPPANESDEAPKMPAPIDGHAWNTPEAAQAVANRYGRALESGDFATAASYWRGGSTASALKAKFDGVDGRTVTIGPVGDMEGAAGSTYITAPITITGTKAGAAYGQTGTMTMRRVNGVPGATQDQLKWRIYKVDFGSR